MSLTPGRQLAHYRLLSPIGEGGMGVVWKADDLRLGRAVALKFLPAEAVEDAERRALFLNEARLASSLNDRGVVQVYALEQAEGLEFIAMEYVDGEPLDRRIARGALPVREVVSLGRQAARTLAGAHARGLVHRDIKPANMMVTREGELKLVDFGLATLFGQRAGAVDDKTATREASHVTTSGGTLAYMSPARLRGKPVDAEDDLYALGVALYEALVGRRPFRAATSTELIANVLAGDCEPLELAATETPPALARIVERCIAGPRTGRRVTAGEMETELGRLEKELERGNREHVPARSEPVRARSEIAVLPFENLSGEGRHAYFAGGLHNELLTQLAKVAALKVISRRSAMGYLGTTKPLKQIAAELGVGSVVEGSVQVEGTRLRVSVQLLDSATDVHLWAERFDRTLDDAFAIQSEVAQRIVIAVGAVLSSAEQGRLAAAPTANADAYQLFLQAHDYETRPGFARQNLGVAQQLLERALGLDPSFALAHAMMSRIHGWMYWIKYDPSAARAALQREEAEAAVRLAPDLPQAHEAMGLVHYWGQRDYRAALVEFTSALKGLPNDGWLWVRIAAVQRRLGNWSGAIAAYERSVQLNPRDADLHSDLGGHTYRTLRRHPDAVRAYDRALSLAPDLYAAAIEKGWTFAAWKGELDTLQEILDRVPPDADLGDMGRPVAHRARLMYWQRQPDSLLELLQTSHIDVFDSQDSFQPSAMYAGWAHELRGDHAAARASFESARSRLDSALAKVPDDFRLHAARGLALAALGKRDEALQEALWLQRSVVYRDDAFSGPDLAESSAKVLALAGDAEGAIDEIERLLAKPSNLSIHTLRLDPRWDPIRDRPRFKALVARHSDEATQ